MAINSDLRAVSVAVSLPPGAYPALNTKPKPVASTTIKYNDGGAQLVSSSLKRYAAADIGMQLLPGVTLPDAFMIDHPAGPLLTGTTNYPMLAQSGVNKLGPMYGLQNETFAKEPLAWFYESLDKLPSYALKELPAAHPSQPASPFHYGPEIWAPEVRPIGGGRQLRLETMPRAIDGAYVIAAHVGVDSLRPETFEPLCDHHGDDVPLVDAFVEHDRVISIIDATYYATSRGEGQLIYKEDRNAYGQPSVLYRQTIRIVGNRVEKVGPAIELMRSKPETFEGNVIEGPSVYRHGRRFILNYTGGNCFDGDSYQQAASFLNARGGIKDRGGKPYMNNAHPLAKAAGLEGIGHTMLWTPARNVRVNGRELLRGVSYQVGSAWPAGTQSSVWEDKRTPGIFGPVMLNGTSISVGRGL